MAQGQAQHSLPEWVRDQIAQDVRDQFTTAMELVTAYNARQFAQGTLSTFTQHAGAPTITDGTFFISHEGKRFMVQVTPVH